MGIFDPPSCGAKMSIPSRFASVLAYLAALSAVLVLHAYALHLDESSETEPTRITQRQA